MGLQRFQPAGRASGSPETLSFDIQAAATFPKGAPMQRDATPSDIEEHAGGSTVTGIIGIALFGASAGVPEAKGGVAYGTKMLVSIANQDQDYLGTLSDGTDVVAADSANVGVDYGMVKVGGEWYVDESDVTDVVLTVRKVFPSLPNVVLFRFLTSAVSN